MPYNQSSLAYDLSAYEQPKQSVKPQLKVVKNTGPNVSTTIVNARIVSAFAIVVTLVSLIIYNQVQLNEILGQINGLNTQIAELESENARMSSDLQATVSLRTIGEQAKNELGMNRLDKHQTEYIWLEQEDKITLTEYAPSESFGQKITFRIQSVIARIQEYIVQG